MTCSTSSVTRSSSPSRMAVYVLTHASTCQGGARGSGDDAVGGEEREDVGVEAVAQHRRPHPARPEVVLGRGLHEGAVLVEPVGALRRGDHEQDVDAGQRGPGVLAVLVRAPHDLGTRQTGRAGRVTHEEALAQAALRQESGHPAAETARGPCHRERGHGYGRAAMRSMSVVGPLTMRVSPAWTFVSGLA